MLASVKKGESINEEEIPPPVASGAKPTPAQQEHPAPDSTPPAKVNEMPLQEAMPVAPPRSQLLQPVNQKTPAVTPDTPAISPLTPIQPNAQHSGTHTHTHTASSNTLCYITCVCVCFRAEGQSVEQTEGIQTGSCSG